jgi:hypothetical protein
MPKKKRLVHRSPRCLRMMLPDADQWPAEARPEGGGWLRRRQALRVVGVLPETK